MLDNMRTTDTHIVPKEYDRTRLDKFLSSLYPDKTRSFLQKLAENGQVSVSGKLAGKNHKLKLGDEVVITFPEPADTGIRAENIPLDIVYEDNDLLVVNKPKGMVVHPAPGNYEGTMVNALMYHCEGSLSGINGEIRPGIVHRIDKNTSGLLIVAKNDQSHQHLAAQIKEHSFLREYEAVVYGNVKEDRGEIDLPIGRSQRDRKKMCITTRSARTAQTLFEVIERFGNFTHMRFRLKTGRTHQIRVHMAHMGHPIAGDDIYGPKKVIQSLEGQCLHAKSIGFIHPRTGRWLEFHSELPEYFQKFLRRLETARKN